MEVRTSPCRRPQWPSLSERSDRRRMGDRGADDPASATWRAQTVGECARGAGNGIFYILWTRCQWKGAQGPTADCGTGTARWNVSITHSTSRCASRTTVDSYFRLLKAEDCRCVAAITSAFLTTASFLTSLWTDWFGELALPMKGWLCLSPRTGHQMPDRPPPTMRVTDRSS